MTLQNKTSRLRAVATKVTLGLGIALVASSIAPMAVAPASAISTDAAISWLSPGCNLLSSFQAGQTGTYSCELYGSSVSIIVGVAAGKTANATVNVVHSGTSTVVGTLTGSIPNNTPANNVVAGDSIVINDVGGLTYTLNLVAQTFHCNLNTNSGGGSTGTFASNSSTTVSIADGSPLEAVVSNRTGYSQSGWQTSMFQSYSSNNTAICVATTQNVNLYPLWTQIQTPHTQTFYPNGGQGNAIVVTGTSYTAPAGPSHTDSSCNFRGWSPIVSATNPSRIAGTSYPSIVDGTWYAVWSSQSCRATTPSVSTADSRPTPQLDLSGLTVLPAPAVGVTGGVAGIDLKGKNLPTVSSVTVAGQDGKVVTSTETALKLDLPTLAPGSYDIVMKTEGNGSITIQNGLVIAAPAPKVDPTPIPAVVLNPSVPRTQLVAATTPVPGFVPGKAGVSEAQKAIVQGIVSTKNVTSLECVGVTNSKVSSKLASARAAAICAAAKQQNSALTTSVKLISEAKVNGPIASVLVNFNH